MAWRHAKPLAGLFGNRRIVGRLKQFYVLHPSASLTEHVPDAVAEPFHVGIADANRKIAVGCRLIADRLIAVEREHLPSNTRICAAQQADVIDLLDQHDQAIKANAHGQTGPYLTRQIAFVQEPRMDLATFEDLDPSLANQH